MRKPLALARAVSIGWVAFVALSPLAAAADATVTIDIRSFAFTPKEVTVAPGTRVVWTNRDDTPHTVTATDHAFASPGLDTGDTFEHTFDAAGDYAYLCTVHPYMTGVVHVGKP
ncbi:MAG TPA: cupredoxin family copper-binding protein [Casimicrobiaceae bacterium]